VKGTLVDYPHERVDPFSARRLSARMTPRAAGLVLHPTSLPGPAPIGDLGAGVEPFLDWAAAAGQSIWQVLPLGPPGSGNSPYSGVATRAGNPLLIALDEAAAPAAPPGAPVFSRVDYADAKRLKEPLLRAAWERAREDHRAMDELEAFRAAPSQADWLEDWTLFASLKTAHGGAPWTEWEPALRGRDPAALETARRALRAEIDYQAYLQFRFFRQWDRVREVARSRGVAIMGDVPIYVALDSADVWAEPQWFRLDDSLRPTEVSGVPPDYFSATGQLWGNPLYRWDRMEADGFGWWIRRLRAELAKFDLVRLDHFRGFASYWAIQAAAATAVEGRWEEGPGMRLFDAVRSALGGLPFIAEDLGIVGDDVRALLRATGLPGMRVMQFGFDSVDSEHAPGRYPERCVAYTGTHDNDTTVGWLEKASPEERSRALAAAGLGAGASPREALWALIGTLYRSAAERTIVPVQDVLGLGSEARMNTPSVPEGNWEFRLGAGALNGELAERLGGVVDESGRRR
jgi:4-alpha-glucanotransferase